MDPIEVIQSYAAASTVTLRASGEFGQDAYTTVFTVFLPISDGNPFTYQSSPLPNGFLFIIFGVMLCVLIAVTVIYVTYSSYVSHKNAKFELDTNSSTVEGPSATEAMMLPLVRDSNQKFTKYKYRRQPTFISPSLQIIEEYQRQEYRTQQL